MLFPRPWSYPFVKRNKKDPHNDKWHYWCKPLLNKNSGAVASVVCPNATWKRCIFMPATFSEKANRKKEWEREDGGRQTDVAGGLKCSSRDLTLEFAGNRTGLRQTEGRGGGLWFCVCVCTWLDAFVRKSCFRISAFHIFTSEQAQDYAHT